MRKIIAILVISGGAILGSACTPEWVNGVKTPVKDQPSGEHLMCTFQYPTECRVVGGD